MEGKGRRRRWLETKWAGMTNWARQLRNKRKVVRKRREEGGSSKTKWAGMTNWIKARKKVENWEKEGGKRKCWEKEATSSPLWQDLCRLVKPEPQSPPSVPFGR